MKKHYFLFALLIIVLTSSSLRLAAQTVSCTNPYGTHFEQEACGQSNNNDTLTAEPISCGDFVLGYSYLNNYYYSISDHDYYSFTVGTTSSFSFEFTGTEYFAVALYLNTTQYVLNEACELYSTTFTLPPGNYFIAVSPYLGGLNDFPCYFGAFYNFHIACTPQCNLSAAVSSVNPCPSNPNGGSATLTASGGALPYTFSWNTGANTQTIDNLGAGNYTATVTDANGCMAGASAILVSTCAAAPGLSVGNITTTSAKIHWSAVYCANSYDLLVRQSGTTGWTSYSIPVPVVSKNITSLSPGTFYDYRLRTVCGSNSFSAYSTINHFYTLPICATPSNIVVSNIGSTTAKISWSAVTNATKYDLRIRKAGTTAWTDYLINATATHKNLTGLMVNTTYEYQLRTKCSSGGLQYSPYSALQTFTTTLRIDPLADAGSEMISLYPNPSSSVFNISFGSDASVTGVQIFDLTGKLISSQKVSGTTMVLGSGLLPGVYFAKIISNGEVVEVLKMMKTE